VSSPANHAAPVTPHHTNTHRRLTQSRNSKLLLPPLIQVTPGKLTNVNHTLITPEAK